MNLLPENASQNYAFSPKSVYHINQITWQCLGSYGCAFNVLYIILDNVIKSTMAASGTVYIYIYIYIHAASNML